MGLNHKEDMTKQHIVFLTGAGVSSESGLSTFRDKDGIWTKKDAMQLASIDGWNKDPQAVLDFYNARRRQLQEVQPNKAHRLLAELEEWYDVCIITQNVDDLHERAGSSHVIHLHGELSKVCSSADKEKPECIKVRPLGADIKLGDKAKDGSQLRPYIVWRTCSQHACSYEHSFRGGHICRYRYFAIGVTS